MNLAEVLSAAEVHALLDAPSETAEPAARVPGPTLSPGSENCTQTATARRGPDFRFLRLREASPWAGLHALHMDAARAVAHELGWNAGAAIIVAVAPRHSQKGLDAGHANHGPEAAGADAVADDAAVTLQRDLTGLRGIPTDRPVVVSSTPHFGSCLLDQLLGGAGSPGPIESPTTRAFRHFVLETFESALRAAWGKAAGAAEAQRWNRTPPIPARFRSGATVSVSFAMGGSSEILEVCWPAAALGESTAFLWSGACACADRPRDPLTGVQHNPHGVLARLPLQLTASFEVGEYTVADLASLKPGQMLPLMPEVALHCHGTQCATARFENYGADPTKRARLVVTRGGRA